MHQLQITLKGYSSDCHCIKDVPATFVQCGVVFQTHCSHLVPGVLLYFRHVADKCNLRIIIKNHAGITIPSYFA